MKMTKTSESIDRKSINKGTRNMDTDRSENPLDDYMFKIFFKEEEIFKTLTDQEKDHF